MQPTEQTCTNSTPSKNGLTPTQAQVLQLLAGGMSISDAARQAGVARTTVYYWTRTHDDFHAALKITRQRAVESVLDEVHCLADKAIDTIKSLMTDAAVPPSARLRAATLILQAMQAHKPMFPAGIRDEIAMANLINDLRTQQFIHQQIKPGKSKSAA
jgi:transposase-like protein